MPELLRSPDEIAQAGLGGSAHLLRRAWDGLHLDGMFLSDRQPALYIRCADDGTGEACRLHQDFWNQGICPALALVTPTEVKVYSGLSFPTRDPQRLDADDRLVQAFKHADGALRHLTHSIEAGEFFATHRRSFNPARRVDRCLLENLKSTRTRLLGQGALAPAIVDALLTRAIFCCYLVDRGVIGERYFAAAGRANAASLRDFLRGDQPTAVDRLYALFGKLGADFNGDLFGKDLTEERMKVTPEHVETIRRLLAGDDMESGQMALDFWAYDFRAIPIETISAIYQEFLSLEGPQERRQVGAYYTPRMLAEVTLDMALEDVPSLADCRFLDPSCGSGIFLVGLFNRMAEELRQREPELGQTAFADQLKDLLRHNLYGVDLNPTACRIAAFSLYLALLDQLQPRDIQALQKRGKFLPKLFRDSAADPHASAGTIVCANAFADDLELPPDGFDLVVGNPPWGEMDELTARWCVGRRLAIPQKQAAAAFMWKVGDHLKPDGRACLVLPSKLLTYTQGPGVAFQRDWLAAFAGVKVLNLSDMSFHLFEGAAAPSMVARFGKAAVGASTSERTLEYCIARSELETLKTDVITVSPDDRHVLKISHLLRDLAAGRAPTIWKQALWGTPRDVAFLDRLADLPTLGDRLGSDLGQNGWVTGEGFNVGGAGKAVLREVIERLPFLPARCLQAFLLGEGKLAAAAPTPLVKRGGCERAYFAPHMVLAHGVPRFASRIKAAFNSTDFTFEHSLRGVHAPAKDESLLRFLTCVVCSPFAMYVYFHNAANWGAERAKLQQAEFERLPFPTPGSPEQLAIITEVARLHREMEQALAASFLAYDKLVSEFGPRLDRLVSDYYGIDDWEQALIEDTLRLWIPSATPRRNNLPPTLQPSTKPERQTYGSQLLGCLNTWAKGSDRCVSARIVRCAPAGLGIVHLTRVVAGAARSATPEVESPEELDRILERIQGVLDHGGLNLRYRRNLKVFAGEDLYILKPLSKRYWCRTAALNDADEIAAAILSRHGRTR